MSKGRPSAPQARALAPPHPCPALSGSEIIPRSISAGSSPLAVSPGQLDKRSLRKGQEGIQKTPRDPWSPNRLSSVLTPAVAYSTLHTTSHSSPGPSLYPSVLLRGMKATGRPRGAAGNCPKIWTAGCHGEATAQHSGGGCEWMMQHHSSRHVLRNRTGPGLQEPFLNRHGKSTDRVGDC